MAATCAILLAGALLVGPAGPTAPEALASPSISRQREGSTLRNELGRFRLEGDRWVFAPRESSRTYRVLENLCLERVARLSAERGAAMLWTVDGSLTEFRGENYLLLQRASVRVER